MLFRSEERVSPSGRCRWGGALTGAQRAADAMRRGSPWLAPQLGDQGLASAGWSPREFFFTEKCTDALPHHQTSGPSAQLNERGSSPAAKQFRTAPKAPMSLATGPSSVSGVHTAKPWPAVDSILLKQAGLWLQPRKPQNGRGHVAKDCSTGWRKSTMQNCKPAIVR